MLYTTAVDRDRYRQEALRLCTLVRNELRNRGISIRSLEQDMGVGSSVYQKALKGRTTMTLETLLQILAALGMEWEEFFRKAYPETDKEKEPEPPPDDFEERVLEILRRHRFVPEPPPKKT